MSNYIRWFLRHRHHDVESPIPVPPPIHTGKVADLEGLPKGERRAIFLCPICGQVAWYSDADLVDDILPIPCPYERKQLSLVSIEAECANSNCESPTIDILALWDVTRNSLACDVPMNQWAIAHDVLCAGGHPPRLPKRRGESVRYREGRMSF